MRTLSALLLIPISIAFPSNSNAQVSDKMLFQLCSPFPYMNLEIFLQETGEPRIMTEESIRRLVEHEMRMKRVFSDDDSRSSVPSLRASVVKHNEAFSASVTYRRLLRGIIEDRWMKVSVWDISRVGTAYNSDQILSAIKDEVDVFISNFLFTQDSQECHALKLEMQR